AAGGVASMGGVFVVQADRTSRKPARREYKARSRRQPLMNSPSESTRTLQHDPEKSMPAAPKKIMLHQRPETNDYSTSCHCAVARPIAAWQDASHFLPNTWPAWWRVFVGPARAISIAGKKPAATARVHSGQKASCRSTRVGFVRLTAWEARLI